MRARETVLLLMMSVFVTCAAIAAEADPDVEAQRATIQTVRTAGTALFGWVRDAADAAEPVAGSGEPEATAIEWSRCPTITHDEATKLLVPSYVAELPRTDGWGHPLQLCLHRQPQSGAHYVLGIRSAGRDGEFAGDRYEVGAFDPDDLDHDVVWLDGYFVVWPERKQGRS